MFLGNWLARLEARLKLASLFRRRTRPRLRPRQRSTNYGLLAAEILEVRQLLTSPPVSYSIAATQPNAAEPNGGPATTGTFTVTKSGSLTSSTTATLSISGTAKMGV